jgi:beta-galactosidase GanA
MGDGIWPWGCSARLARATARRLVGHRGLKKPWLLPAVVPAVAALALIGAAPAGAAPRHRGWTQKGCPAATTSAVADTSPGTPTAIHVIAGNGSVTVSWCAPTQGQSNVVSYTVTASTGQTLTAKVPNDYVIFNGLTNGTSYSFTVTANTSLVSGVASVSSRTVRPKPVAEPKDVILGTPQTVTYDNYSLIIGGKRTLIYSAEFDPWRLASPSLWLDRLEKIKADGYNAVTPYFDWGYSSSAPGVYDFTGIRDMNEFLNMAQEAGLYVIARPGPYINAETDAGGFPGWLVTQSGVARTNAPDFEAASDQWLSEIDPIIAAHQITRGGDVILYQVENELFDNSAATDSYMSELKAKATAGGIDVPLSGNSSDTFEGTSANQDIPGYDSYPLGFDCSNPSSFTTPPTFAAESGVPLMLPEYQGGSYDSWGGSGYANCYALTGPSFENVFYKSNLSDGVTIQSNYMGVGATNWGWLPAPFMYTSYDYGSAISETGEIGTPSDPNDIVGSKYGENKLIGDFTQSQPSLAKTGVVSAPQLDNSAVSAEARSNPDDGTQYIYLRQANASSTATVTTHMALEADQTSAYTYDDGDTTDLDYTGTWSHVSNQSYTGGDYDNTESFSDVAGDSMSVTFTGTAVQWIAPTASNHGIADVYVDGTQVATVDGYSSGTDFRQLAYSVTGLAAGSHTLKVVVMGTKDAGSGGTYVSIDAINVPTATQVADYFPTVPQSGSITLVGRDSRLLVANEPFDGQQLVYSTSEMMTHTTIDGQSVALLYGANGTDGETVLHYASEPNVKVLAGAVTSTWDASRDDLRLDYTHNGLAEVRISGGGNPPLLLLLTDTNTAEEFWPESTAAGNVLVQGSYLARAAQSHGSTLALTGDTSEAGTLTVWAPSSIKRVTWNGRSIATSGNSDGSLSGSLAGPAAAQVPTLTGWRFSFETPEAQPAFNDDAWTLADQQSTTNPTKPVTLPVLFADDYGFHYGFIWYRGHFTATGNETGITLTAGEGSHGAFSVWLNGAFLGSDQSGSEQAQKTFTFPAGLLKVGKGNVIAVLVQSSGHDEDGVYSGSPGDAQKAPRGLLGAALTGASTPVTWRLDGADDTSDPVRGPYNPTGLYGTDHGWDLAGYPTSGWQPVSLPDDWSQRSLPTGVGWYRTQFRLSEPQGSYVPMAVQIDGDTVGAGTDGRDYRAFVYVNGWLIGQYDNALGPQHQFYVPAGILREDGENTIAIADWSLNSVSGGLGAVKLVALGDQAGGVAVSDVDSPGYNARVDGAPSAGEATLDVTSSSSLVTSGTALTVKAAVGNWTASTLRDVAVTLSAPSGFTINGGDTQTVSAIGSEKTATVSFTVKVSSGGSAQPGVQYLVAHATYTQDSGAKQHPATRQHVTAGKGSAASKSGELWGTAAMQVPYPSLAASFDNVGITDNSNMSPGTGFIGFDGEGTSFSLQGLAAAGLTPGASVTAGGLTFTWPDVAAAEPDNTMALGQVISVSGSGSELGFLASANNSALSGTGTVYYTDGTTSTFTLDVGNFWYQPSASGNPANIQAAAVNYANYPTGSSNHTVYIFEQSVAIDPSKTVEAVALPSLGNVQGYNAALHVFATGVGS